MLHISIILCQWFICLLVCFPFSTSDECVMVLCFLFVIMLNTFLICDIKDLFIFHSVQSVQSLSHVQLFVTPWTASSQASLSITNPRACSNSCPSSQWCQPTISSSVVPSSSCLQSFPASGSFPLSQFFSSGGQIIGASA